jgi:dTDP-4-amino-4,6-dideoxygalactose transaminase
MDDTSNDKKIFVTKPFLPPFDEVRPYLEKIWASRQLTNDGVFHAAFEEALCEYLGVKYISLVSNGTMALLLALKALNLSGEVITTPFSWISTAQSLYWNNLKPVFVDISSSDLNIDSSKIERAISPETSAILPVHVFGNPCNVAAIREIAEKHGLKVVYDAAHCFGVNIGSNSVLNFGDLSILSFHATKVMNSLEGGAIISRDAATKKHIDALKNNGFNSDKKLIGYGLNAKMNEIQAAFGLAQLKHMHEVVALRKAAVLLYREHLKNIEGLSLIDDKESVSHNYSYFPVIVHPEKFGAGREELLHYLNSRNIFPATYFYPLITDFPEFEIYKTDAMPTARFIADRILCLPLFHDISVDEIKHITQAIIEFQKSKL